MKITVFTTGPGCHLCLVTKTHMKKRGLEFEEVRIDQNEEWYASLKAHGFETAPVVLVGEADVWGGYSGDSIDYWADDLVVKAA